MNQNIGFRIAVDIAITISVIFGWWYIALPIGLIALFKFPYFFEFVVAGFAYDALFGMGAEIGFLYAYAGTIVTGVISAAIALVKSSIR